ncbi:FixH family protein [Pedobacter sp. BS3]|uniref:FixH family protein n=1 Tax=Pedobacter sp. BS3 TaxID=2567937 RepID=UPI001658CB94|nr:FixH family protein [Pedobacter sp. BS3]
MSWGTKIIIGMGVFMAFIVAMGAKMIWSSGSDGLVEQNYYEHGLKYDQDYIRKSNAVRDSIVPDFFADKYGLTISFRFPVQYKLNCRYLANARFDRVFEGYTDEDGCIIIPRKKLKKGMWLFRLEFTVNNIPYLVERTMKIP